MNKSELINELSERTSMSKFEAQTIVETFLSELADSLADGNRVEIRGFGTFRIREKNPRKGRNPKTGESIAIDKKRFPHFKPGKDLRDLCERFDNQSAHVSDDSAMNEHDDMTLPKSAV